MMTCRTKARFLNVSIYWREKVLTKFDVHALLSYETEKKKSALDESIEWKETSVAIDGTLQPARDAPHNFREIKERSRNFYRCLVCASTVAQGVRHWRHASTSVQSLWQ